MPFSHNGLKTTTGIQVFSQVNKCTLSYQFLYGNVQGCVFAKNRPVSLNWTDYTCQRDPEVYATRHDPKIYPHTKFRIPTSNYIQICSELSLAITETRGQGHSDLETVGESPGSKMYLHTKYGMLP